MHCHLFRTIETTPYTLNHDELALLVFKALKLSESDIRSIDTHSMKIVKIEVYAHVNIDNHALTAQYQVRPGLMVQPMKEVKKERWVKLYWVPHDMPESSIKATLSLFGEVMSGPFQTNFEINDKADELTKKLKSIKTNNRVVEMLILRNIPSYIKVENVKIKVVYQGQDFTCARCLKSVKKCKADAKASDCKEPKRNFEDFWEQVKNWEPLVARIHENDKFNTETLNLYTFPQDTTKKDIFDFINTTCNVVVSEDQIKQTNTPNVWMLIHVGLENVASVISRIQGRKFQGRFISAVPFLQNTPERREMGIRTPPPRGEVRSIDQRLRDAENSENANKGVGEDLDDVSDSEKEDDYNSSKSTIDDDEMSEVNVVNNQENQDNQEPAVEQGTSLGSRFMNMVNKSVFGFGTSTREEGSIDVTGAGTVSTNKVKSSSTSIGTLSKKQNDGQVDKNDGQVDKNVSQTSQVNKTSSQANKTTSQVNKNTSQVNKSTSQVAHVDDQGTSQTQNTRVNERNDSSPEVSPTTITTSAQVHASNNDDLNNTQYRTPFETGKKKTLSNRSAIEDGTSPNLQMASTGRYQTRPVPLNVPPEIINDSWSETVDAEIGSATDTMNESNASIGTKINNMTKQQQFKSLFATSLVEESTVSDRRASAPLEMLPPPPRDQRKKKKPGSRLSRPKSNASLVNHMSYSLQKSTERSASIKRKDRVSPNSRKDSETSIEGTDSDPEGDFAVEPWRLVRGRSKKTKNDGSIST